ncbi:MAG: InlB B-repeat-containing protein, partial [Treponema sp.]|nr:InlB B-repeat-containing protein [Treponema sp.]
MKKTKHRIIVRVLAVMAAMASVLLFAACPEGNGNNGEGEKCTVTFDTDGGVPADISPIQVVKGKSMGSQCPDSPAKQGYTFGGWYEGSKKYTADTKIEKDVDLKARWNEI